MTPEERARAIEMNRTDLTYLPGVPRMITPEERARRGCDQLSRFLARGEWIALIAQEIREAVAEVEQKFDEYSEWLRERAAHSLVAAVAEEREACAAAMCHLCAEDVPLLPPFEGGPLVLCHDRPDVTPISWTRCTAAAIRARQNA